jgi:hypothetical protein
MKPTRSALAQAAQAALEPHREAVLLKLAELAKAGDPVAIKLFLSYAVGVPATGIELSGPDGEAIRVDEITRRARIAAIVEAAKLRSDLA